MTFESPVNAPTLEEIKAFCLEIGVPAQDGEYIFYHWEGNGFTRCGKPIKKWKSVIQAWRLAGYLPSQRSRIKSNLPSASEVRKVIREYRDRVIGMRGSEADEFWERTFQRELQCSYQDAMRVLK